MASAKKKKKFFDVEIPSIQKITQVQAYEIEELEGRFLTYDLTRFLKGKNMLLQAKIYVKDKNAVAVPTQTTLLPYYIKRMVRKGTQPVEDSFSAQAKDVKLKIKPLLVTRRKVSRVVSKALREKAREEIINYVKEKNSEEIFDEVIRGQMQKPLSLKLKKIYPLSTCEIRILKVEN